jgi:hypothetical protein
MIAANFQAAISMRACTVKEKVTVFFGAIRTGALHTIQLAAVKGASRLLSRLLRFLEHHLLSSSLGTLRFGGTPGSIPRNPRRHERPAVGGTGFSIGVRFPLSKT